MSAMPQQPNVPPSGNDFWSVIKEGFRRAVSAAGWGEPPASAQKEWGPLTPQENADRCGAALKNAALAMVVGFLFPILIVPFLGVIPFMSSAMWVRVAGIACAFSWFAVLVFSIACFGTSDAKVRGWGLVGLIAWGIVITITIFGNLLSRLHT